MFSRRRLEEVFWQCGWQMGFWRRAGQTMGRERGLGIRRHISFEQRGHIRIEGGNHLEGRRSDGSWRHHRLRHFQMLTDTIFQHDLHGTVFVGQRFVLTGIATGPSNTQHLLGDRIQLWLQQQEFLMGAYRMQSGDISYQIRLESQTSNRTHSAQTNVSRATVHVRTNK